MAEANLGKLIAVFPARQGKDLRAAGWALGTLGVLAVIGSATWGSWQVYQAYFYHGPAVIGRTAILPGGLVILGFLVLWFAGFQFDLGKKG